MFYVELVNQYLTVPQVSGELAQKVMNEALKLSLIHIFNLPFPVTFTQITWFVITEFIIILFGDMPPLSMIEGAFLKYFGIPVALTLSLIHI